MVTVHKGEAEPKPLDPQLALRQHSRSGFEWAVAGVGAAQLALALAMDLLNDPVRALDVYTLLEFALVVRLPKNGWTLTEVQLRQVVEQGEQRRRSPKLR